MDESNLISEKLQTLRLLDLLVKQENSSFLSTFADHNILKLLSLVLTYDVPEDPEKYLIFSSSPAKDCYLAHRFFLNLFGCFVEWKFLLSKDDIDAWQLEKGISVAVSKVELLKNIYSLIMSEIEIFGELIRFTTWEAYQFSGNPRESF